MTDEIIPLAFTVTLLFLSGVIHPAVNPVGIPPPVWERWCQERSNQTQTLQVGCTDPVIYNSKCYG